MNVYERAAQIWAVLAWAAHNRQVLTYSILSKLTGVASVGLGQCLEPIHEYCLENNLPPLTILVVSSDTGLPSSGFKAAEDIPATQLQVFGYDWLEHGAPKVALLEATKK